MLLERATPFGPALADIPGNHPHQQRQAVPGLGFPFLAWTRRAQGPVLTLLQPAFEVKQGGASWSHPASLAQTDAHTEGTKWLTSSLSPSTVAVSLAQITLPGLAFVCCSKQRSMVTPSPRVVSRRKWGHRMTQCPAQRVEGCASDTLPK